MKRIKKIKESSKAVAGAALLVGATLAGGAAMVSAQDSGSSGSNDLGDYPSPFIDDDGEIASTLVMGADAKATDVVAATEIAGQLGNDAAVSETRSVDVAGSFGWSADGGVTLDTRNDQLYFGDSLNSVRETLTQDDLDFLSETTFRDDSGTTTDITSYLDVADESITFGNDAEGLDNEDPVLHVGVPAEDVDNDDYLVNLQANFGDSLDFSDEDVQGEEIELFGKTYTVSQDDNADGDDELVLYGSSEEVSVETGESTTVTINGEEHTLEVVSVNEGGDTGNAAIRVDGNLRSEDTDATFNIDGQQVRVDQIIKTGGSESSTGVVQFAIGSQELVLSNNAAIEDDDGDEVEGTYVQFNGGDGTPTVDSISSIDLYLGAEDDDNDYLAAGDSWSHSMFEDVKVSFGGLNPDASENGENVGQVEVSTSGDDTASYSLTGSNGDDASIDWAFYDEGGSDELELADSDGDAFVSAEGQPVEEDQYFATDAGDFSHMWEVTGIDRDTEGTDLESGDEATVDLRDAVTGNSVEVELEAEDLDGDNEDYTGEEVIDGQTYHFVLDGSSSGEDLRVAWGDSADFTNTDADEETGVDTGDLTSVYTPVDTDSGAATAFTQNVTLPETTGDDYLEAGSTSSYTVDTDTEVHLGTDVDVESGASDVIIEFYDAADTSTGTKLGEVTLSDPETGYENLTFSSNNVHGVRVLNVAESSEGDVSKVGLVQNDDDSDDDTFNSFTERTSGADSITRVLELPSTESTDAQTLDLGSVSIPNQGSSQDYTVGQTVYTITNDGGNLVLGLDGDQTDDDDADVTGPAALTVLPQDDSDNEEAYINTVSYDGDDEEVVVDDATYTGGTRDQSTLESDDNVEAAYDVFGAYSEYDDDGQGEFTLNIPDGQSTAGAAVTGAEGELSASAGASGSVESMMPTGWPAQSVALDSDDYISSVQEDRNLILVGGPAANSLTQDLADANKTWETSDYTEGEGLLQLVPEAFNEDHDALVVAGYTGEDTRAAGSFLSNYGDHQEALAGETQVTVDTASGSVVQ